MGEVGANASETTAPADSGNSEPKENGGELVNGTVDDPAATSVVEVDAAPSETDAEENQKKKLGSPKHDAIVKGDENATEVIEDEGDVVEVINKDPASANKEAVEDEEKEEKELHKDTEKETLATDVEFVEEKSQSAAEKQYSGDSPAEPPPTDTSSTQSDSTVAKSNHLAGAAKEDEVSKTSETIIADSNEKQQQEIINNSATANGKATSSSKAVERVDTEQNSTELADDERMEVDADDVAAGKEEIKKSSSPKAPQNGDGKVSSEEDTVRSQAVEPRPKPKDTGCDDEPMEVDGGSDASSIATNGHKEVLEEDAKKEPASSKAATNKEKTEAVDAEIKPSTASMPAAPEVEDDDDKPVSINSDSDSEEPRHDVPATTRTSTTPKPKPPTNVIVVDEGGLAKLGEGAAGKSDTNSSAAVELPVGNGEATIAVAAAKSGLSSNSSSNGIQQAVAATTTATKPVATGNQNGDCDGDVTILSDKEEDCVVIEDDDDDDDELDTTPATPMSTPTASSRRGIRSKRSTGGPNPMALVMQQQSKNQSLLNQRMDEDDEDDEDDDDDVEEIIDDPLASSAPMGKGGLSGTPLGRSSMGGQYAGSLKGSGQKSLLMNNSGTTAAGGKEPTLVIIDTNTLMNNNGSSRTVTSNLMGNSNSSPLLGKAPVGMMGNMQPGAVGSPLAGAQFNSRSLLNSPGMGSISTSGGNIIGGGVGIGPTGGAGMLGKANASQLAPVTPLLPALTDDMFVLEAPSFIVPYIYEKPPVDNLRDILDELEEEIKEMRKKLEESGAVPPADKASAQQQDLGAAEQQSGGKDGEASKKEQETAEAEKEPDSKKKKRNNDDDDEWDELDTSTDDEASDEEQKTKVLIKEARADIEAIKEHIISPQEKDDLTGGDSKKQSENYFENPLGKFFMNIGINQVQEFVQTDLLRQQKRKRDREGKPSPSTQMAINSLMKNLEQSKENNKPYKFEMKRCEYCPFKSESALVMAHHYETPHMRNFIYKCNFCSYETRPPHDILYHMEAVHNIKGRMEKALSYHHCPNCPFEDNGKSKLARHAVACAKKFRPEINLNPPLDWEPPAKIPRIKPKHGLVGTATAYQAMTAQQQKNLALANQQRLNQQQGVTPVAMHTAGGLLTHQQIQQQQVAGAAAMNLSGLGGTGVGALNNVNLANLSPAAQAAAIRARAGAGVGNVSSTGLGGRAPAIISSPTGITASGAGLRTGAGAGIGGTAGSGGLNANALASSAAAAAAIRNTLVGAGMVIPNNLQLSASALAAAAAGGFNKFMPNSVNAGRSLLSNSNASITIQNASSMKATKTAQPPSISITPLPRQSASGNNSSSSTSSSNAANMANIAGALSKLQAQGTSAIKPGQNPSGGKTAFVVCEICDGYIKDLDQLRNHMQWIHKVKIHPKMIYNRPPLNCQKCQYRFFTDQGLERHLLGSHGLVTSSMQEAANKGKDAGRCPVCGRVYQWKLLNHVSRDHNMTLKPAHLSYKCTVCTATFGMYKQFESHVYSAHSTVAKKTVDSKGKGGGGGQQTGSNMGATSSSGMGRGTGFGAGNDSLLKPLKINDEITIIPQPTSNSSKMAKIELESHVID
uniref:MOG interacting and ectopic P-granules protein 1 n=1 Tax=Anopheles atroparvus TaxID=41427 RepID=A0AAG5DC53_ANOAO